MTNDIKISRELAERLAHVLYMYDAENTGAATELDALIATPVVECQEPVAYCYKEYVWATGIGAHVWRDKLETEKPGDDSEIKDLAPLYTSPPAPVSVPEKYDEVLLPFLALMRSELHANAHKGDRPGWLQMDSKTAILEVFYHMGKLHQAVHRGEEAAIKEYAADVANMCMMLLDVCACIDKVKELNQ